MIMCGDLHMTPEAALGRQQHICTDEEGHEGDHTCGACRLAWPNLYHGGKSDEGSLHFEDRIDSEPILQRSSASTSSPSASKDFDLVLGALDMLNEHCVKQEALHQAAADSQGVKRWWAARVHLAHCHNLISSIQL